MDCLPDKISQFDFFFRLRHPKRMQFPHKEKWREKKEVNIKAPTIRQGRDRTVVWQIAFIFCVYNSFFLDTQETLDLLQGCNFILLSKTAGSAQRPFLRKN